MVLMDSLSSASSWSSSSVSNGYNRMLWCTNSSRILNLKRSLSSMVKVSALAMTGTTLTSAQFFHHNNVDGSQGVARRADEVETAVNACVLDVPVSHGGQLLAKVGAVLVLNVLDNRVPAVLVVNLVSVARCVDNVKSEPDTIFDDNMGFALDFSCLPDCLLRVEPALGLNQMGRENGVNQSRFSQSSRADDYNVELETPLEQLVLDLLGNGVESNIGISPDFFSHCTVRQ
jgi:hypothetical protein